MLNRVAVLSDIHGVLPALEAVLAEPDVSTADHIVLTGDITAGPQPAQVLDLLTSLGDRVIWISGNADRELLEYRRGQRDTIPDPIAPWAAEQLREDLLDLLGSLPRSLSLSVDGLGKVLFCHATPRDDEEVVLVDSRLDRWEEVFDGLDTDMRTVVCGRFSANCNTVTSASWPGDQPGLPRVPNASANSASANNSPSSSRTRIANGYGPVPPPPAPPARSAQAPSATASAASTFHTPPATGNAKTAVAVPTNEPPAPPGTE